jgi:hypothetical protein
LFCLSLGNNKRPNSRSRWEIKFGWSENKGEKKEDAAYKKDLKTSTGAKKNTQRLLAADRTRKFDRTFWHPPFFNGQTAAAAFPGKCIEAFLNNSRSRKRNTFERWRGRHSKK